MPVTVSCAWAFHPGDQVPAQFANPDQILVAKLGGAQELPELAGIQIQTEQGKPLMAIPQRHRPGLELSPLRIQVLPGGITTRSNSEINRSPRPTSRSAVSGEVSLMMSMSYFCGRREMVLRSSAKSPLS